MNDGERRGRARVALLVMVLTILLAAGWAVRAVELWPVRVAVCVAAIFALIAAARAVAAAYARAAPGETLWGRR
ncbi:hypothetical protein [Wenxinia marina]|uniref:Uncharacterized protein n=1 Tax=Wenxinia marina DSM 24838 TaxID=1123501 RepID=A0A0D0QFF1_9RHOB|nr:hypothetical protein [Wenxinia marina]KIQ71042.1 hypothetical protein Wenmar_00420 [Wenxinia marina DSM 24838]GGL55339.1 hypothetical protein GCM10011392_07140 [Wenxinia marina]